MLAVAGHSGTLLIGRDTHKSVVAGLIFPGLEPCWVSPQWDAELHLAHLPSPEQITPYPPGIPVVLPGERINDAVIDHL